MPKQPWRKEENAVEGPLVVGEWYRTPLSDDDHCLGRVPELLDNEDAWCGYPLGPAYDWDNIEFGGLWYSNRQGGKCSQCARKEREYLGTEQEREG